MREWETGREGRRERKRDRRRRGRERVAEGGRVPTEKGWNHGRTINLTIYSLRREREEQERDDARSKEEARK